MKADGGVLSLSKKKIVELFNSLNLSEDKIKEIEKFALDLGFHRVSISKCHAGEWFPTETFADSRYSVASYQAFIPHWMSQKVLSEPIEPKEEDFMIHNGKHEFLSTFVESQDGDVYPINLPKECSIYDFLKSIEQISDWKGDFWENPELKKVFFNFGTYDIEICRRGESKVLDERSFDRAKESYEKSSKEYNILSKFDLGLAKEFYWTYILIEKMRTIKKEYDEAAKRFKDLDSILKDTKENI